MLHRQRRLCRKYCHRPRPADPAMMSIPATPLRLLHITTVPMSLGFLRGQIAYMKERGFDIALISSPGTELEDAGEREGVPVHAVEMRRSITPLRDVRALAQLVLMMRQLQPTIVHAHTPKGGLLGMVAATLCRVPIRIYHMRGLPLMGAAGARRRLLRLTEWVSCRLAHEVICVSHSVRHEAVDSSVCATDRISVLLGGSGNGVDALGRFDPAAQGLDARKSTRMRLGIHADDLVLGFVGRIVRDKGIVELSAAWQQLRARHPQLRLLLVGPFEPEDAPPAEVVAALNSDERVHLVGMDWNTPPLYAAMDVVVLPSYREGFPNVPLEAAAMGLPVVATRIPGCVDAVAAGETGLLVEPRDAAALAGAIEQYVTDANLRQRHGQAGRDRVLREFRQEAIWAALYDRYVQLLARKGFRVSPSSAPAASSGVA
jgi:glycosyltransferase involved in cell wall biosynthesis